MYTKVFSKHKVKPGAIIIEGHVQGLANTRSLGSKGIPVYVIDSGNCIARYSRYCQKYFKCPSYESDDLVDFLIDLADQEDIQDWILLPSNDHAVLTLSRNRERLTSRYKLITPGLDIVKNIYDKSKLLETATSCDVPIPNTFYPRSYNLTDFNLSFPVLTKGKYGLSFYKATGKKAFLARSFEDLTTQLQEIAKVCPLDKTFVQELIPNHGHNKTISFTAFCIEGHIKTHWVGEKVREHPDRFGTATFARSINGDMLYDMSQSLLNTLKYSGVCEVEYLLDPRDNQYKLIEINARTWLWVELAINCGIDYPFLIYNYLNKNPNHYSHDTFVDKKWFNFFTDTYFSFFNIINKNMSFRDYLHSFNNSIEATFKVSDVWPFLVYFLMIPQYLKKR